MAELHLTKEDIKQLLGLKTDEDVVKWVKQCKADIDSTYNIMKQMFPEVTKDQITSDYFRYHASRK